MSKEIENTRMQLKIGDKVKLKSGDNGVILQISKPLGFREFKIKTDTGFFTVTALHIEEVISDDDFNDSSDGDTALVAAATAAELAVVMPQDTAPQRFAPVQEEDVNTLLEEQKNKRTKAKTEGNIRLLNEFLKLKEETRRPEEIPADELNTLLGLFFMSVRKADGTQYEPGTLKCMQSSFERYLKENGYKTSIITSIHFERSRAALASKQKELKKKGKGNKPKASQALTNEEKDKLYEQRQLGCHSPQALINTLWLSFTIHFGLRGVDEHRKLLWGDITMASDHTGQQYLEFNERETKTRTGTDVRNTRMVKPRMWPNTEDEGKCPIAAYSKYSAKRPSLYSEPHHPFYIATNSRLPDASTIVPEDKTWFRAQPIGINKLGSLMSKMSKNAGIRPLTNHSARKHLVQELNDAGVPANQIMQITGHKNIHSINNYSSLSIHQQKEISNIIANRPKPTTQNIAEINCHPEPEPEPSTSAGISAFPKEMFRNCQVRIENMNVNIVHNECKPTYKRRRIIVDSDSSDN